MERTISNKRRQTAPTVRSILLGGTGATTPQTAIANLGGIHASAVGGVNGIAPLDASSKIPDTFFPSMVANSQPALDGPTTIYTTSISIPYFITNYDSLTVYTITTNKGTLSVVNDTISLTPEATPGIHVITINGKTFPINVVVPYAEIPTIASFAADQNSAPLTITVNSDIAIFGVTTPTISDIHVQLSLVSDFTTLIHDHHATTPSWTMPKLAVATTYYLRVKYQIDELTTQADWSSVVQFTTKLFDTPTTEVAQLHAISLSDSTSDYGYGSIAISHDGNVIVTGDEQFWFGQGASPARQPGRIFIYSYQNSNWVTNAIDSNIVTTTSGDRYDFGYFVAISADKQKILTVTRRDIDNATAGVETDPIGAVKIYQTVTPNDYSVMTEIASFPGIVITDATNIASSLQEGFTATPNFETIAFSARALHWTNNTYRSGVHVLNYNGTNITHHSSIEKSGSVIWGAGSDGQFGQWCSISDDGLTMVISNQQGRTNNVFSQGELYIYERIANVWTETYVFEANEVDAASAEQYFGYPVTMSPNGVKIATFSNLALDNTGYVYLFEKVNNVWAQTKKFALPEMKDDQLGGEAYSLCFNADGSLLLLGSPWQATPTSMLINGSWDDTGMVYLFDTTGPEIVLVRTYIASDASNGNDGEDFGNCVAISRDSSTIAITSPWRDWQANGLVLGTTYVYR